MRIYEITRLTEAPEDGTFAGFHLYKPDARKLHQFALDNEIPNAEPADKMHVTVMFSRTYIPNFKPMGMLKKAIYATPIEVRKFGEALVIVLDAPEVVARHKYIMNHYKEATYDHDEFIPHVTLSYDSGRFDEKTLDVSSIGMITLVEEYTNDINPDWGTGQYKKLEL